MNANMRSDLQVPVEILEEINKIIPSDDPLDNANFNEIEYINKLFPTEQSLVNIDEIIIKFENDIRILDEEIRQSLHEQIETEGEGLKMLDDAKQYIEKLVVQISDIKTKAETSELMVKEMTQDIRQLDRAKQNLTLSITTLNHLHMLVGGVESLEKLIAQRKYGEIASLLQGVLNVLENFDYCMDISQIKEMATKVYNLRDTVGKQIFEDFKNSMTGSGPRVIHTPLEMYEACRVIDIMEPVFKKEFIDWFITLQLAEYSLLFQETQDEGWLDKVDRRFAWFKKYANDFTDKYYGVFPQGWEVLKKVALQFCEVTRKQLSKAMYQRYSEIDVKLLLFAIQKTGNFETLLAHKFKAEDDLGSVADKDPTGKNLGVVDSEISNPFNEQIQETTGASQTSLTIKPQAPPSPFIGLISRCFEDHLDIFLKSQERNIKDMVDRFAEETRTLINASKMATTTSSFNSYATTSGGPLLGSATPLIVLPSCADLFVFYKSCLVQCAQLSTVKPMVAMATIFRTYLNEYATKVMTANIPKVASNTNSSSNFRDIATFLKDTTGLVTSDGSSNKLSLVDISLLCVLIGTAEYCSETTRQLENKMKEKIDPSLVNEINFQEEVDSFQGIIGSCITALIQDMEITCEPFLITMAKTNWLNCEGVGDQSKYVTCIINCLKSSVPVIRENLTNSRKYFTQFCIRFVNSFIPKYLTSLYKCKPVGTVGAEQLLLDTHSLKTVLLDMPSLGLNQIKKAPISFTKIVIKGMTKAEMILKVVMTPHDSVGLFVENCAKLLPDLEFSEFQKILDIKGIKRSEQSPIIESYKEFQTMSLKKLATSLPEHNAEISYGNQASSSFSGVGVKKDETGLRDEDDDSATNPFAPVKHHADVFNSSLPDAEGIKKKVSQSADPSRMGGVAAVNYFLNNDPTIKKLERLMKKKNPL